MAKSSTVPNVWIDADFSGLMWSGLDCDDDLALLALLAEQSRTLNLVGVSVCGGNAPLSHAWKNIQALWHHIHFDAAPNLAALHARIGPKKGYGWKSMQVSRPWMRFLHTIAPDVQDSEEAVVAIVDHALQASKKKDSENFSILTLGPPTNVARALERIDQLERQGGKKFKNSISHVYMMGGELTGRRLDLNFLSDRAAARSIIENENLPVTLVTIQLCAQVVVDDAFVTTFEKKCCRRRDGSANAAACAILPKMKQQVFLMPRYINPAVEQRFPLNGRWKHSPNIQRGFVPWDVVAGLLITHPELFAQFEYHQVAFPECPEGEPCDKTMTVLENHGPYMTDSLHNHSGIVRIPHLVINETLVLEEIHELLCQVPAVEGSLPGMMLGFFSQLLGILLVSFASLVTLALSRRKTNKKE